MALYRHDLTSDFVLTLICLGEEGLVGGVTLGDGPGESPNIGSENFSTSMSASWSSRSDWPGVSIVTIFEGFLDGSGKKNMKK